MAKMPAEINREYFLKNGTPIAKPRALNFSNMAGAVASLAIEADALTITSTSSTPTSQTISSSYTVPSVSIGVKNTGQPYTSATITVKAQDIVAVPRVERIIRNGPATIVFWKDGTRTVVKCMEGTPYDEYSAFTAAVCKKIYGSSAICKREGGFKKEKRRRSRKDLLDMPKIVLPKDIQLPYIDPKDLT